MTFGHEGGDSGEPSKVVVFRRPHQAGPKPLEWDGAETFPRFRREWNRPNPPHLTPTVRLEPHDGGK